MWRSASSAPGGGYVFTQIHNVQSNIAPESVVAVYDAAIKYGGYPVRNA